MALIDVGVPPKHVQVIRSNIGPELDLNWLRNVEMFKIS
jgi:hypothetical protein